MTRLDVTHANRQVGVVVIETGWQDMLLLRHESLPGEM